jgi:hypothetical protein
VRATALALSVFLILGRAAFAKPMTDVPAGTQPE